MSGKIFKDFTHKMIEQMILFLRIIISLLTFFLVAPIGFIVPKKKRLTIFIGNFKSVFSGNVKYLYLHINHAHQNDCEYYYLAEEPNTFAELAKNGLPVLLFPSIKSIIKLYQANVLVVDNDRWVKNLKYHLLLNCHKVQLWHGVGFKRIDPGRYRNDLLRCIINVLRGRFPKYDLVISTSEFYSKNVFATAFKSKKLVECGYSRNDIFFNEPDELDLLNVDVNCYNKIKDLRRRGYQIILYAPTFRDLGGDALSDNALDIEKLTNFANGNKLHFIFKFHPSPQYRFNLEQQEGITLFDNSKDVYPLLSQIDMMITDYSSIYMDYLLLKRPVVFFPYDYEYYVTQNREIQFDYDWITPGPKCYNQAELENEIVKILIKGEDDYSQKRKEILDLAFKYQDGNSSARIWQYLKEYY